MDTDMKHEHASRPANQGFLFSPTLLPRQLPLYKEGPEDAIFQRLANRQPGKPTTH